MELNINDQKHTVQFCSPEQTQKEKLNPTAGIKCPALSHRRRSLLHLETDAEVVGQSVGRLICVMN